jgi:hypothetical protein
MNTYSDNRCGQPSLKNNLQDVYSQVSDHHGRVKMLLGEIALWETTVLKPLKATWATPNLEQHH